MAPPVGQREASVILWTKAARPAVVEVTEFQWGVKNVGDPAGAAAPKPASHPVSGPPMSSPS